MQNLYEKEKKLTLSRDQHQAVGTFMEFITDSEVKEMVLMGSAGMGKTTLIKKFIEIARQECPDLRLFYSSDKKTRIQLTSTTNKAAKVLAEATGEETKTIHSLIGLIVQNNYKTGKTYLKKTDRTGVIENSIIVVDEAGMCNKELLESIRKYTNKCKILWVLDHAQLTAVFENECPVIHEVDHKAELTTIHRTDKDSEIFKFANYFRGAVLDGVFPTVEPEGNQVHYCTGPEFEKEILNTFNRDMEENDARVLSWTNKRTHQYNNYIRTSLGFGDELTIGERVLTNQPIMNDGSITLGVDQIATIKNIHPGKYLDIEGWKVTLDKDEIKVFQPRDRIQVDALLKANAKAKNWQEYFAIKENVGDLRPIHACTVQKSQGSTYKKVFIDLADIARNTKDNEIARLCYVAISRASEHVYLTGSLPKRIHKKTVVAVPQFKKNSSL